MSEIASTVDELEALFARPTVERDIGPWRLMGAAMPCWLCGRPSACINRHSVHAQGDYREHPACAGWLPTLVASAVEHAEALGHDMRRSRLDGETAPLASQIAADEPNPHTAALRFAAERHEATDTATAMRGLLADRQRLQPGKCNATAYTTGRGCRRPADSCSAASHLRQKGVAG